MNAPDQVMCSLHGALEEKRKSRTHAKGRVCPADSEARATRAPNLAMIRILVVTMGLGRLVGFVCVLAENECECVDANGAKREDENTRHNPRVKCRRENRTDVNE